MNLQLSASDLTLSLTLGERLLSFRWASELCIPRRSIVRAVVDEHPTTGGGVRMPGTGIPGVVSAGSYMMRTGWEFRLVFGRNPCLRIDVNEGKYGSFVLSVDDPAAWAARLGPSR